MLRFLRARGAGHEAEDFLHELWVKVRAARTGPVSDPLAYLYGMANHLMLDHRRSSMRRLRREQDWTDATSRTESTISGEHVLSARAELQAAHEALIALGERTDLIFRRFRLDGATQQQIAQEMGISLSAVEKHLQRAYRALLHLRLREASAPGAAGDGHD